MLSTSISLVRAPFTHKKKEIVYVRVSVKIQTVADSGTVSFAADSLTATFFQCRVFQLA